MSDATKAALWILSILAIIALGIWFRVAADCSVFQYAPIKDVPARCIIK